VVRLLVPAASEPGMRSKRSLGSMRHREAAMWTVPQLPPRGSVALVGCVKKKLSRATSAADLYVSPLFKRQREWATARCDRWFILSAKYCLVAPDDVIEPYELTLKTLPAAEKRAWSAHVVDQLKRAIGSLDGIYFEIYAGADYVEFGLIAGLKAAGGVVALPWRGLGLGERIARREYAE